MPTDQLAKALEHGAVLYFDTMISANVVAKYYCLRYPGVVRIQRSTVSGWMLTKHS